MYSKNKKNPFADNPYIQKGMSLSSSMNEPDYQTGDKVSHFKFGTGTVTSIQKLENDYEVVVSFDDFGQRKLRSSFARLTKLSQ